MFYCKIESFFMKYFGMLIGVNLKLEEVWELIIKKVRSRFVSWKGKMFLIAGRLILIKFILNNLFIYYMFLYFMFICVVKKIISI